LQTTENANSQRFRFKLPHAKFTEIVSCPWVTSRST